MFRTSGEHNEIPDKENGMRRVRDFDCRRYRSWVVLEQRAAPRNRSRSQDHMLQRVYIQIIPSRKLVLVRLGNRNACFRIGDSRAIDVRATTITWAPVGCPVSLVVVTMQWWVE